MKKFTQFLAKNPFLTYLNLGQNKLGDPGLAYLSNALKNNKGLRFLDLFDVDFSDTAAIHLT